MKKKVLAIFLSFTIFYAFAENLESLHNFGLGFTIPVGSLKFEEPYDSVKLVAPALQLNYLLFKDSGFSLKASMNIGGGITNIDDPEGRAIKGFYFGADLGLGHKIYTANKFTLAGYCTGFADVTGNSEKDVWKPISYYHATGTGLSKKEKQSSGIVIYGLGLDLTGLYHFTRSFSIFSSIEGRYYLGGEVTGSNYIINGDWKNRYSRDFEKGLAFAPTIGLIYSL